LVWELGDKKVRTTQRWHYGLGAVELPYLKWKGHADKTEERKKNREGTQEESEVWVFLLSGGMARTAGEI